MQVVILVGVWSRDHYPEGPGYHKGARSLDGAYNHRLFGSQTESSRPRDEKEGGAYMSSQELTDALEEVLAAMDVNLMDDVEDEVETAARAVRW